MKLLREKGYITVAEDGALELTEYYMITDTGWYALES